MSSLIAALTSLFAQIDYGAIFILMAVESSIIPFPSEVVMIPAGINAANNLLNPWLAALVGGLGSLLGALVNYFIIGRWLGVPFLKKYGKYFLIREEQYQRAEALFQKNAMLYTFVGRLMPVIRQLISVPAGLFKMSLIPFCLLTFIGATLWSGVLVFAGMTIGKEALDLVSEYSHLAAYILIPLVALFLLYHLYWKSPRK